MSLAPQSAEWKLELIAFGLRNEIRFWGFEVFENGSLVKKLLKTVSLGPQSAEWKLELIAFGLRNKIGFRGF